MARAYTKKQKRDNKKKNAAFDLAETPKRDKNGCFVNRTRQQPEEDPRNVAMRKRASLMGKAKITDKVMAEMRSQSLTDGAGRCLVLSMGHEGAAPLIDTYAALSGAYARFAGRELGLNPHAKSQKIEMLPESMPDAMEHTPDFRSEDEKDIAARRAWGVWTERLDAIGTGHASAIWTAYYNFADLHEGDTITPAGERFVAAMRVLQDESS